MFAFRAIMTVCASALAFSLFADQLTVTGTVTDSVTGSPVSGAAVSLRMGTGMAGGGTTYRDTTGADGVYSITVANNTDTTGRVSASATGYLQNFMGQRINIASPSDGTADNVTANVKLRPTGINPTDTTRVTIIAVVLDTSTDAVVSGATVTVTAMSGTTTQTATGTTDAQGRIVLSEPWGAQVFGATATATKAGYTSGTGFAQNQNDTIDFDTIRVATISAGDSINYQFTGFVRNSQGTGIGNAVVSVVMTAGGSQVYSGTDTTTNSGGQRGRFTLSTREAYAAAMSVTVTVLVDGYAAWDSTFVPAAGVNTLNVVLVSTSVVYRSAGAVPQVAGQYVRFLINGRYAGSLPSMTAAPVARTVATQACIVKDLRGNVKPASAIIR